MIKFIVSLFMAILFTGICYADDPGERDTIIVETVYAELGDSIVDVIIYATCDDSVAYYNFPLTWVPFNDSSIQFTGITYYSTLTYWDDLYDTLLLDQEFLRMWAWADVAGRENPPLFTNNQRWHFWTLHFAIDSLASPQVVFIDTTYDPINGSLLFGLIDGWNAFTPEFVPGAIFYGITSDIKDNELILPSELTLSQNYPNPFNASTTIEFALPKESGVELAIYDLLGRKIKTLIDEHKQAGVHTVSFDASDLSSGVYFYRLQARDMIETKRMVLLK